MTRRDRVIIRTPEGVEFALPLAGLFSRMLAFTIDICVILAAEAVLSRVAAVFELVNEDTARAFFVVTYFVGSLLYGMLTEWLWRGQTIGKRLVGLRVVEANGLRLTPAQVAMRNLLRFADLLPVLYLVGGVSCYLSSRRQRLGDIAAGTIVTKIPQFAQPNVAQMLGNKFNSFLSHPHLAARLRQKANPAIVPLAMEAVLRRDDFEPGARLQVFREFADYFRTLAQFPPEVIEQISDEQYVRNTVAIMFQKSEPAAGGTARIPARAAGERAAASS
jgi:uncharacterized RDD family membrane protein YckC